MAWPNTAMPNGMKHLLEDDCAGERPPKRLSPPSLPTFSPEVASTPGECDDDCIVVSANKAPRKNISEQQESSSPTRTRGDHMAYNSRNIYSALAASNESETDKSRGADAEVQDALMEEIRAAADAETIVEPDLLDELQTAVDYMEVTAPDVPQKPEAAIDLEPQRTPQKPKPFVCIICNNRFARKSDLTRHERATNHVYTGEEQTKPPVEPAEPPPLKDFFKETYGEVTVPLKDLDYPKECMVNPEIEDELFEAFLEHATVVVSIWANYDGSTKLFFTNNDNRHQDCGKVYLSPQQRRRLDSLDSGKGFEMKKMELHIGTAFRTFFKIFITIDGSNLGVKGHRVAKSGINAPHKGLQDLVMHVMRNISAHEKWEGDVGLTLTDLDRIARAFI